MLTHEVVVDVTLFDCEDVTTLEVAQNELVDFASSNVERKRAEAVSRVVLKLDGAYHDAERQHSQRQHIVVEGERKQRATMLANHTLPLIGSI